MRNYSNSGWIVPVAELAPLFNNGELKKFLSLLETDEVELIENFLWDNLPRTIPKPEVFMMADDAESQELEADVVYASFDESDLFESKPTEKLKALQAQGIDPELMSWVTFG